MKEKEIWVWVTQCELLDFKMYSLRDFYGSNKSI